MRLASADDSLDAIEFEVHQGVVQPLASDGVRRHSIAGEIGGRAAADCTPQEATP